MPTYGYMYLYIAEPFQGSRPITKKASQTVHMSPKTLLPRTLFSLALFFCNMARFGMSQPKPRIGLKSGRVETLNIDCKYLRS